MGTRVVFSNIREEIIQQINKANFEIIIAVAWFTDKVIMRELLNKVEEDCVKVKILFYEDKINSKDFFIPLYRAGAKIRYRQSMMHNKFCIIDGQIVINGSYNWTQNARLVNQENIQITIDKSLAQSFRDRFNELFKYAMDLSAYVEEVGYLQEKAIRRLDTLYGAYKKSFPQVVKYPAFFCDRILVSKDNELFVGSADSDVEDCMFLVYLESEYKYEKLIEYFFQCKKKRREEYYKSLTNKEFLASYVDDPEFQWFLKESFKLDKINFNYHLVSYIFDLEENQDYIKMQEEKDGKPINRRYDYGICDGILYPQKRFIIIERSPNQPQFSASILSRRDERRKTIPIENWKSVYPINYPIKSTGFFDREKNCFYGEQLNAIPIPTDCEVVASINNHVLIKRMTHVDSIYDSKGWTYVSYIDIIKPNGELVVTEKKNRLGLAYYYEIVDKSKICIIIVDDYSTWGWLHEYKILKPLAEAKKQVEMYEKSAERIGVRYDKNTLMGAKIIYDTNRQTILSQKEFYKEEIRPVYREEKDNCYIATMAYHDINHPKVQVFRMFRDNTLVNYEVGRRFISFYYEHSPSWVKVLKDKKRINYVIRKLLDGMVYVICRLYKIDFDSVNKK